MRRSVNSEFFSWPPHHFFTSIGRSKLKIKFINRNPTPTIRPNH